MYLIKLCHNEVLFFWLPTTNPVKLWSEKHPVCSSGYSDIKASSRKTKPPSISPFLRLSLHPTVPRDTIRTWKGQGSGSATVTTNTHTHIHPNTDCHTELPAHTKHLPDENNPPWSTTEEQTEVQVRVMIKTVANR